MAGRLKMDEIAVATGYSISTVSRVLSGKSYTSEKAREAIVQCARKLGVLDELSSGRLYVNGIAVFAPGRTFTARGDVFYHEVTKGIADATAAHDVYLSYCGLEEQRPDLKLFLDRASNKNINAIIIIGTDDPTIFKLAATLNKPCVLINSVDREMQLDCVSPDHRAIGYSAARYLFERGYRRIISLTCLRRETLYARLEGIKEAYRDYRTPFDPQHDLLITEAFSPDEAESAMDTWLSAHPREHWPEAILCGCAEMAIGVQRALDRHGLRMPEDISLLVTDFAWHLEKRMRHPVTGIAVPCRELGVEAVHLLQNRLNRPQAAVFNLLLQGRVLEYGTVLNATRYAARAEQAG
ncbi:LacI family DNA-binding transcriptional regulator [Superficieibacter sp.]|uniref:LacI family DNA-binding transcriptional regulator n=1 Tax=Superficieibacter sp. TaxID=2303322 RepID=UPI0028A5B555|nr:LacI family DNA-binding transcriptional regulator [Superficieibacter sp.]